MKEKCPKCSSEKLRVFFMNGKSYCNDYNCLKCGHNFSFSKMRNKYYGLSKERNKILTDACNAILHKH